MYRQLIILFFTFWINQLNAQEKMIIDKPCNGHTFYNNCSVQIDSFTNLPSLIQNNVTGYIKSILGTMSDSLKYSLGQVVDLKKYFSKDSITYGNNWIVPKYELNFVLQDNSIGIIHYCIEIRLDQYGQILYSNWPKKYYSDKTSFKSRASIEQFAIKQAVLKGFNIKDYLVDFKFNDKLDKLCWIFEFPISIESNNMEYNAFEIDWTIVDIVEEYYVKQSTVY